MNLIKKTDRLPFLFDDLFTADWLGGTTNTSKIGINTPPVNVKETDNDFTIELAAPGLLKEDFNIELDNDMFTISSKSEKETESDNGKYTRKEFNYSSFKRSFSLPDTVDSTKIDASYENGVLRIGIPKKEEAKVQPKRLIEIS